jgi:hypothetical protein
MQYVIFIALVQDCFDAVNCHYCIESFILQEAKTYCWATSASRAQEKDTQI